MYHIIAQFREQIDGQVDFASSVDTKQNCTCIFGMFSGYHWKGEITVFPVS